MGILDPTLKVPFDAWDLEECDPPPSIDQAFRQGVVFNTYQLALQASLELMGTRLAPLPVILPVTVSPHVMSAVLRSGASPVLLDVDYQTLQMNPTQLQEALQELQDAIVLLTTPAGQKPAEALLKQVEDLPTIIDTGCLPAGPMPEKIGSFTVYDLTNVCGGSGGLVIHPFAPQLQDLKLLRSGLLGHGGALPDVQVRLLHERLSSLADHNKQRTEVAQAYIRRLKELKKSKLLVFSQSENWPYVLIRTPNAATVVTHLRDQGVQAVLGVYPLHLTDELKGRWKESPEYETAENLMKEIVALPTVPGLDEETCYRIIDLLVEVC